MKYTKHILAILLAIVMFSSCEKFFNPTQDLDIDKEKLFDDWYEYRSAEMGLYGLQQKLVEQLLILGELRGDLLNVTTNADADMIEVNNFSVSKKNKYASPVNFYKLIAACNSLIQVLKEKHPEVLDKKAALSNYDRLFGEALCMRAWAYFNAVRIYGKVPYIHESLGTLEEIQEYVNSPGVYVDEVKVVFGKDGFANDTIRNAEPISLEKKFFDESLVLSTFIDELVNKVKAVGVNHSIDNSDKTWELVIWSDWSYNALLGHMYLTQGDINQAAACFEKIVKTNSETKRYQLDSTFRMDNWQNIFTTLDNREHIYAIPFLKNQFQQNKFQDYFDCNLPHKYMLKPTSIAVRNWESQWTNQIIVTNDNPKLTKMTDLGDPSDLMRGYGVSYVYGTPAGNLPKTSYIKMLYARARDDFRTASSILAGQDTMVLKYSIGKATYDQDASYIVYRAGGIHLYLCEIYNYLIRRNEKGDVVYTSTYADALLNDASGSYYNVNSLTRAQLGVRGRVGLGSGYQAIKLTNILYIHDFYSNRITGYKEMLLNYEGKQRWFEEQVLNERARELAFEGERFYDLVRIAKRRNDPTFLAKMVSAKYPAGKREAIYEKLCDMKNWYVNYFE